jgi:hypothetical protein
MSQHNFPLPRTEAFQSHSLELIQAATMFLETVSTLDAAHRPEYLARLDHIIGFNGALHSTSAPQPPSKADLIEQAEAAGMELDPWVVTKIMDDHIHVDDVLYAIKAFEWKSKQEHLDNPSAYFSKVLADRQSKRENHQNAA